MIDPQRRRVLQTLGIGTAALVGGVGTAAAEGKRKGASGDATIVDIVQSDETGFNTLEAAVIEAGLADALSGNRQWTVFAPTDAAFNAIGLSVDNEGLVVEDPAASLLEGPSLTLTEILTYHVTPGRRYAASIVNPAPVETLNGAEIDVNGMALNGGSDELGGANIIKTDIEASNGVIHPIDGVLLP